MGEKYSKTEIRKFASNCACGADKFVIGIEIAEEMVANNIYNDIIDGCNKELLIEIAKKFAKYSQTEIGFDVCSCHVSNFQNLIEEIVKCCEKNNWFTE